MANIKSMKDMNNSQMPAQNVCEIMNPFLLITKNRNGITSCKQFSDTEQMIEGTRLAVLSGHTILGTLNVEKVRDVEIPMEQFLKEKFCNDVASVVHAYNQNQLRVATNAITASGADVSSKFDIRITDTNNKEHYIRADSDGFVVDEDRIADIGDAARSLYNAKFENRNDNARPTTIDIVPVPIQMN